MLQQQQSPDVFHDPLLHELCSQSWTKQSVYDDVDASPAKLVYSAHTDFPYFGERLLALQEHVLFQAPNDFRSLWRDRRDVGKFWGLAAVIGFGIATLMIGVIQIILAAAQLGASQY
jgi:hypothetical protein